jgi:hypothetical protein
MIADEVSCKEVVELVTAYLETVMHVQHQLGMLGIWTDHYANPTPRT